MPIVVLRRELSPLIKRFSVLNGIGIINNNNKEDGFLIHVCRSFYSEFKLNYLITFHSTQHFSSTLSPVLTERNRNESLGKAAN